VAKANDMSDPSNTDLRDLTITPDLLAKVDELANRTGQSRAALINRAIYDLAERMMSDPDDQGRMPKLTRDAFNALLRKPSTYFADRQTDEDRLQFIAADLRAYEAGDETASDIMEGISRRALSWLPDYLDRLRRAADRAGDSDGNPG
jgi:ribbon-helix-helix CopG family protein